MLLNVNEYRVMAV